MLGVSSSDPKHVARTYAEVTHFDLIIIFKGSFVKSTHNQNNVRIL